MYLKIQKFLTILTTSVILLSSFGDFAKEERNILREDPSSQPPSEKPLSPPIHSPYILYGPHGYRTFPHSRCQEVPTVNVTAEDVKGDWYLIQYVTSHDGKPFSRHPYLCPESRMIFEPQNRKMNISQISYEWPLLYVDVVEWIQHPKKTGLFFHEENIFSLWTMKVMELKPDSHMIFFLCIDYTIWPGWNHRGVYVLSRHNTLKNPIKRKLSRPAHKRMRMEYDRVVNTTVCNPDEYFKKPLIQRWHPHKKINKKAYRAPVHPYMSRKHRRNLKALD